jgi:hypothetical protein
MCVICVKAVAAALIEDEDKLGIEFVSGGGGEGVAGGGDAVIVFNVK